jgi:hypothetical protein
MMNSEDKRFDQAIQEFDAAHREDPRSILVDDQEVPWSLLYHQRMTHWLKHLAPDASELLLLAARCQHIRRWTIPRSDYPMDRSGYKRWRKRLAQFHADQAAEILTRIGYDPATIDRLGELLQKFRLKLDPEVQLFEDAICLVFLENEFSDFAQKHDEDKLVTILQKTWTKMSSQGHQAARELVKQLDPETRRLVEKALK